MSIPILALLIPIISVTASLAALIIWIRVWHRRRVHEVDCRHKERMAAIEKGLELPPESLPEPAQMPPRARYLLRGLIWLGVGLALTFGVRDWFGTQMLSMPVGTVKTLLHRARARLSAAV